MSYDLMVFDPEAAPRDRKQFMVWYQAQTEWAEDHNYNDPSVTTPALQAWFYEMIKVFPAMNGPCSEKDEAEDNPKITDYCIGKTVIYSAFAWACAEEAHTAMKQLAIKHKIGFFDVSAQEGEIIMPGTEQDVSLKTKSWWRFW